MKKKIYGVLVVLCCPILLNTQHVFAEEGQAEQVDIAAVEEIIAEALMTVPEAMTAPSVEPVMEESATEDSTTMDSSTEVTEETTNSELPATEESTTDTNVVEEVPTVDSSTEESVVETPVEVPEESAELPVEEEVVAEDMGIEPLREVVLDQPVTMVITYVENGTVLKTETVRGVAEIETTIFATWATNYVVASVSDNRFSAVVHEGFKGIELSGHYASDLTSLTVELVSVAETGVYFNMYDEDTGAVVGSEACVLIKGTENTYSFTPPQVDGYDYTGPAVITGTFPASGMEMVNVNGYKKQQFDLRFINVDESGNLISIGGFTHYWGAYVTVRIHEITTSGRKVLSINGVAITEFPYEFTFLYPKAHTSMVIVHENLPEEDIATDPLIPSIPNDTLATQPNVTVQPVGQEQMVPLKTIQPIENNKKVLLPETGEESNVVTVMAGTVLFLQAGYMMLKKKNELES
ncbi:LPXTG cell wall anchor domain-containing protein [Enterococcus sp. BWR-S5]|uniref:LPXTG cell wall anchor domain-containing protein n=1 Tax=Enterococcus sp. BWR-S5 TaxID=2787714 RepID=UPI0019235163|nr:LPXTG cell wall anchor domain-containing protein [Enterococcus sp. BWR-S5]MBL1226902.1 LPXTG cell wall anchor domain-containing protein [Enterococcus sp. BWR-S5]